MTCDEARAAFESDPGTITAYRDDDLRTADALPAVSDDGVTVWVRWSGGEVAAISDELAPHCHRYEWPWSLEWIDHDYARSVWYVRRAA